MDFSEITTLLAVSILIQKHVKSEIVRPKASMHYACRHSHELLQTWIGSIRLMQISKGGKSKQKTANSYSLRKRNAENCKNY